MSNSFDYIAPELEPIDSAEADLFAQEDFVADIQSLIYRIMEDKGISRVDLSKRLGISKPRVTQYFAGDGSNLTARTIARIFHALGEQPEMICEWTKLHQLKRLAADRRKSIKSSHGAVVELKWTGGLDWCRSENDNCQNGDDMSALIMASRGRERVHFEKVA